MRSRFPVTDTESRGAQTMKGMFFTLLAVGACIGLIITALNKKSFESTPLAELKERFAIKTRASVDHTVFPQCKEPCA
jgi:hypothetical protein